jgi:hypothetical protein
VQKRCNRRFKNVVLQAAEKVRQLGPEDLRRSAQELEARGAHTEFAIAKRLVRLTKISGCHGHRLQTQGADGPRDSQSHFGRSLPERVGKADCHAQAIAPEAVAQSERPVLPPGLAGAVAPGAAGQATTFFVP